MKTSIQRFRISNEETERFCLEGDVFPVANEATGAPAAEEWLFVPWSESTAVHEGRRYKQVFGPAEGKRIIRTFNSLVEKARRFFRPLPIFAGHPDEAPDRYPDHREWGGVKDIREAEGGVELLTVWNEPGLANKTAPEDTRLRQGSPVWDVEETGGVARPFRLVSVGLTNRPNIKTMPLWNEAPISNEQISNEEQNMNLEQLLKKLAREKGLITDDTAADAAFVAAFERVANEAAQVETQTAALAQAAAEKDAAMARAGEAEAALKLANEERAGHETMATEQLKAKDEAIRLANERAAAAAGTLVDALITGGLVPFADKEAVLRLANADPAGLMEKLPKAALNTRELALVRPLRVANERQEREKQRTAAVDAYVAKHGGTRGEARLALRKDPAHSELFTDPQAD